MRYRNALLTLLLVFTSAIGLYGGCSSGGGSGIPADIRAILEKPLYDGAIWGLRVVDLDTGEALIDLEPEYPFFIGPVRQVFTVGELLNEIGPEHKFVTPVYKQGEVNGSGVLDGELILVASGDLTMGGRTKNNGRIALSDFDHNDAGTFGNAVLTKPDPVKGYRAIAQQIADSGITQVDDVVIDDRLWEPFPFRNEGSFAIRPIFVNDDCVDLTINPTSPGQLVSVEWRPVSAALDIVNEAVTGPPGSQLTLVHDSKFPQCIGEPGCTSALAGQVPVDYSPPLTNEFPLIGTVRIVEPQNYARTLLIELLEEAGVTVLADAVAENPEELLPPKDSYTEDDLITSFVSLPYSEYAKLILKVSYSIGADASLLLWGLTQGVDNMDDALAVEKENLTENYGVSGSEFSFIDGSGGGDTKATNPVVTRWLEIMAGLPSFGVFFDALSRPAVDGFLVFVTDFEDDPTLAGAAGNVRAVTGTYPVVGESGIVIKGQAFGGYIDARSGRRLAYQLVVNDVPITGINDLLAIIQDEGTITAILWRDF